MKTSRSRRLRLGALPLLLAAVLPGATPPAAAAAQTLRPNVLFIAIDDLRDWVGYLGRNPQARTPNFDRLARLGTAFTRAYCAAPICNPSRAALMSGLRPSTTGVYSNPIDFREIIPADRMLTTAFRHAGYFVHASGKIFHGHHDLRSEFQDYLALNIEEPGVPAGASDGVGGIKFAALDCADDALRDWHIADYGIASLQKKHDKPFFLAVGFIKPHMPWNVPRKWFDLFPLESIQLPPHRADDLAGVPPTGRRMAGAEGDHEAMLKSGRWKEAVQAYLASVAYMDMNLGRLLDAFERSAYRDNTIVCVWGDHGWNLGEKEHWRKSALWEETTRAPFIWIAPGLTKPGTRCDRTVDLMSIYPTLMELCGIPTPRHVEGVSIRPLLANPAAPWALPAITTHGFNNHAVRSADWRYIRYANGEEELYDEAKDPNEWTNLAAKPGLAATKAQLAAFLPKTNVPTPARPAANTDRPAKKKRAAK